MINRNENYQDKTKQTSASLQLESGIRGLLLQQMHPVETFMMIWEIIRHRDAVKPRGRAGLWGYTHWSGGSDVTWELCRSQETTVFQWLWITHKWLSRQTMLELASATSIDCLIQSKKNRTISIILVLQDSHLNKILPSN